MPFNVAERERESSKEPSPMNHRHTDGTKWHLVNAYSRHPAFHSNLLKFELFFKFFEYINDHTNSFVASSSKCHLVNGSETKKRIEHPETLS